MTLRDARGELLDQAKTLGAAVLDATGRGATSGPFFRPPRPPEYRPVPYTTLDPSLDAVAATEALAGAEPLTAAVARAGSVLEGALHPRREVVVVSDLQAATFTDSASAALPPGVDVTLVPLGGRRQTNTAVTDVRVVSRIVEPGRPVVVEATVVRYGGRPGTVGASVSLDGQRVAETAVDLAPGRPSTARFTVTPPARGWVGGGGPHRGGRGGVGRRPFLRPPRAPAPPCPRRPRRRTAGGPRHARAWRGRRKRGPRAQRGRRGGRSPARTSTATTPSSWSDRRTQTHRRGGLAAFVAGGGGVLAFPGDELEALNPLLQAVGGGRIDGVVGERGGPSIGTTTEADLDHPRSSPACSTRPAPPSNGPTCAKPRATGRAAATRTTLIGLQAGPPLLQEIQRGEGRVLLVGVAPDLEWSDLPQRGLFVPLLYRAAAYLAAGTVVGEAGGEPGSIRVEGVDAGQPLRLVGPDGVTVTPLQRTVPGAVVLDVEDAVARAGLYRVVVQGERTLRVVAVNEDARESDPTPLDAARAAERLEAITGRPVRGARWSERGGPPAQGGEGTPLWTVFLALALTCLVARDAGDDAVERSTHGSLTAPPPVGTAPTSLSTANGQGGAEGTAAPPVRTDPAAVQGSCGGRPWTIPT